MKSSAIHSRVVLCYVNRSSCPESAALNTENQRYAVCDLLLMQLELLSSHMRRAVFHKYSFGQRVRNEKETYENNCIRLKWKSKEKNRREPWYHSLEKTTGQERWWRAD